MRIDDRTIKLARLTVGAVALFFVAGAPHYQSWDLLPYDFHAVGDYNYSIIEIDGLPTTVIQVRHVASVTLPGESWTKEMVLTLPDGSKRQFQSGTFCAA